MESDVESKKKNDPSHSSIVSYPTVKYKPRIPYPQGFVVAFPFREDKQKDDPRDL